MQKSALSRFLENNSKILKHENKHKGLPYLGLGVDNGKFSGYTGRVAEGFDLLGVGLEKLKNKENASKKNHYLIRRRSY